MFRKNLIFIVDYQKSSEGFNMFTLGLCVFMYVYVCVYLYIYMY